MLLILRYHHLQRSQPDQESESLTVPVATIGLAVRSGVSLFSFVAGIWAAITLVQHAVQWFAKRVVQEMLKPRKPLPTAQVQ